MRIKAILSIAALAVTPMLGFATLANAQGGDADGDQLCEVVIDRSQESGVYDLTRQVYQDGNCICYLYTGPEGSQSESLENQINALTRSRTCPEGRLMDVPGQAAGAAGGGVPWWTAGVAAGLIGGIAAATNPTSP